MYKFSIVPDTNVFIDNLELIKTFMASKFPINHSICIPRTVIQELDNLKLKKKEVRDAIKYIQSISLDFKVEIEGFIDERRLEVDLPYIKPIEEMNNDDKIINYILKLENPVFLTNDVSLRLKCQSYNIRTVQPLELEGQNIYQALLEVLKVDLDSLSSEGGANAATNDIANTATNDIAANSMASSGASNTTDTMAYGRMNASVNPKDCGAPTHERGLNAKDCRVSIRENSLNGVPTHENGVNVENKLFEKIRPMINQILMKELGKNYSLVLKNASTLQQYLRIVVDFFFLFEPYLPLNSKSIIQNFIKIKKNKNAVCPEKEASRICLLFRCIWD